MQDERGAAGETRWLQDDEQRAWRDLVHLMSTLPAVLDADMQRRSQMTVFEYTVLAGLSEAPGHTLRMLALADFVNSSLSRLSHVVTRLEARGLVARQTCPDSGRSTEVVLTAVGLKTIEDAAPGHVAVVREIVVDALGTSRLLELGRLSRAVVEAAQRADPRGRPC